MYFRNFNNKSNFNTNTVHTETYDFRYNLNHLNNFLFDCTDIICDILILNRHNCNIVESDVKHYKPDSENDVSCGSSFYIDSCGC